MVSYLVVVPSYKAAVHLKEHLPHLVAAIGAQNVLVIDDGSGDETPVIAQAIDGLHFIGFAQNQGKGTALAAGIEYAQQMGREWCLSLDADGQHSVDDIPTFLEQAQKAPERCAILAGAREFHVKIMPWARVLSNRLSTWMVSQVAGAPVFDAQCGFRMYNTALWSQGIYPKSGRFEWEPAVLVNAVRAGYTVQRVPVKTLYPEGVGSHISHFRDIFRFLRMLWRLR